MVSTAFGGPVSVRAPPQGSPAISPRGRAHETGSVGPLILTASSSLRQLSLTGLSTTGGDYMGLGNVDGELADVAAPEPGS